MAPPFYLDENVTEDLAAALAVVGFDAATTRQVGRKGVTDPEQLLYARRTGRVLITHNGIHYRMLHETLLLWGREWGVGHRVRHAGILVVDQRTVEPRAPGVVRMVAIVQAMVRQGSPEDRLFAGTRRDGFGEVGEAGFQVIARP